MFSFTLGLELATWCALASLAKCAEDLKIPNVHFSLHGVSRLVWFQILLCESPAVCMCSQRRVWTLRAWCKSFKRTLSVACSLFTNFSRPVYHACLISLIEGDKASGASRTQRTQGNPHYSPLLGSEPDRGENPVFENRLQPGAGAH